MSAVKTKPFRVLWMDDEDCVAVIRYDGDPDVFTALAWAWCIAEDIEHAVEPPQLRLFRINPDSTGEYAWLLGEADRRGHGVFLGARLCTARRR